MRKSAVAGLTLLAAFALGCGAGSGETTSSVAGGEGQSVAPGQEPKTTTAKIGQTVTLTSELLGDKTVIDVTVANAKQHTKEPEFGLKPDNGVFLVVNVTVVCKEGTYHANPFNFQFVAKDGTVTELALTGSFKPALGATDLSVGQKASGKVVFDLSKEAIAGGQVQIDGFGADFDEPAAFWTVS